MSVPVNLTNIQSGLLTAAAFNSNFTRITEALGKALNREGGVGNNMEADLDMGLHHINNLLPATLSHQALSLGQYTQLEDSFRDEMQGLVDEAENYKEQAGISAANAANSANAAGQSETQAGIHAANALASAGNSAQSAANALTSEQNAQGLLEDFQSRYYGTDDSDPAVDPNDNPPTEGDLYYNTVENQLKVRVNGLWISAPNAPVFSVFGRVGTVEAEAGDYSADQVDYSNTTSGLTAVNVQAAIDEVEVRVSANETAIGDIGDALDIINGEVI